MLNTLHTVSTIDLTLCLSTYRSTRHVVSAQLMTDGVKEPMEETEEHPEKQGEEAGRRRFRGKGLKGKRGAESKKLDSLQKIHILTSPGGKKQCSLTPNCKWFECLLNFRQQTGQMI